MTLIFPRTGSNHLETILVVIPSESLAFPQFGSDMWPINCLEGHANRTVLWKLDEHRFLVGGCVKHSLLVFDWLKGFNALKGRRLPVNKYYRSGCEVRSPAKTPY